MVDEAELTLLHSLYISNFDQTSGLDMINTLPKNFEHEQNILNWGVGGVQP